MARRAPTGLALAALLAALVGCVAEGPPRALYAERWVRWGRAQVLLAGGDDGRGGGTGPVLVYLHGFASLAEDQLPLRDGLEVPVGTRFVFPEGPVPVALRREGDRRAWWRLDRPLRARLRREPDGMRELAGSRPAGLDDARATLEDVLDGVERELGAPPERTVLAGFSQGAMLACDAFLRGDRAFAGVGVLSGTVLTQPEWQDRMSVHRGRAVFVSHGREDPLLPFAMSERLAADLTQRGVAVTWFPHPGGHEMTERLARAFAWFVEDALRGDP